MTTTATQKPEPPWTNKPLASLPANPVGSVIVETIRHGRPLDVRVDLYADDLDPAHDSMRTSRIIHADSQIYRDPGKQLRVGQPSAIYPPIDPLCQMQVARTHKA